MIQDTNTLLDALRQGKVLVHMLRRVPGRAPVGHPCESHFALARVCRGNLVRVKGVSAVSLEAAFGIIHERGNELNRLNGLRVSPRRGIQTVFALS